MTRLSRTADRLTTGSSILTRRLFTGAAAWCARGRRKDLTGWKATLGIIARVLLLSLGAYLVARIVRALPSLMWLLSSAWTIAAWRAAKPAGKAPTTSPTTTPPTATGEALRGLLLDLMGDDSAVHLSTVLDHLQQRPDTAALTASWQLSDLRARLEAQDIPVHPKVKAGRRGPTRGVRRADLPPSPAAPPQTSTAASTSA